jgi:hypothetical protein
VKAATSEEKRWLQDVYVQFMSPQPVERIEEKEGDGY